MAQAMGTKRRLSTEDRRLFRDAVDGIRRLHDSRIEPTRRPPAPLPASRIADEQHVCEDMFSDLYHPADFDTGEELQYLAPGVSRLVMRKLRRGQYATVARLDLHGMTVPVARQALLEFLARARQQGQRCVLIVHGKGLRSSNHGPVIKPKLAGWLRQRREVLAFCSARPADGGTGAVYLLLKPRSSP